MVTWAEVDRAVDDTVAECLERACMDGPPVEPVVVAEALGIRAQLDAALSGRGERRTVDGRSLILVRPDQRSEREHFAIAHEIGEEIAMDVLLDRLDLLEPSDQWRETVANRFAARLLCPTEWLRHSLRTVGDDLRALKTVFVTASHEVIARQTLLLDVPTVVTVIDNGKIIVRLGNVPHQDSMNELETRLWQKCSQLGRDDERFESGVRVQGWALHEDGWKREILRTTRLDD